MTADLETLVVAAYYFASLLPVPRRRGRPARVNDAELVALAVCQAVMGIPSDRQFLGLVRFRLPGWFLRLPEQSQYNRRLRELTPLLVWVQQRLSELLATGQLRLADGTLVGVANYAGCAQRSEFAGVAAYGFCPAKSEWVWGVRLVLLVDGKGLPCGYTLTAANEKEYGRCVSSPSPTAAACSSPTRASGAASTPKRCACKASSSAPPNANAPPTTPTENGRWPACGS